MSYAFTPFAIPYLITLILAGFISIYAFVFFERTRTNLLFVGLTSSLTVWISGTLLEILATTKDIMIFWDYFRFIGINLAAVFFLLFCFSFTYFAPRLFSKPINIIVFFIPGIIDYFFLITNETHNLFFEELSIHPTAPFPALYRVYGILFLFHFLLNALFVGAGVITLVLVYRRSYQQTYRRQIQLILSGVSIFVIIAIIYHFRIFPATEYLDITPLGYIVTCLFFLFGIREYHLIDIVPMAHQVIIANLTNTGVIVTDINKRVIEINP
ncbi:MAG: histidine kinase N-terminal 7TM domain-containing protein, partial [Candidatus Hermodarchaeota archaeon]